MKRIRVLSSFAVACLCGALIASQSAAVKRPGGAQRPAAPDAAKSATVPDAPATDAEPRARVVQYGDKDVVRIKTKLRYTTLIVLPKNEQVLDFTCGDKEYWIVNGNQNFAYIKPAKAGSQTNLNLVTASGNVYSFVLAEISEVANAEPDLKVFVELTDESMASAAGGSAKFVSARELENYRQQVEIAKDETRQVKQATQAAIDSGISRFVSNVRFPYRFEAGKKPFFVRAMYHDDKFTYVQARPEETPTLYEIKDGKPNLVNFDYKNGVYVVDKILDRGYLVIGKQKLGFTREE
jgi:type IV secretory pathway VirB9-like protein